MIWATYTSYFHENSNKNLKKKKGKANFRKLPNFQEAERPETDYFCSAVSMSMQKTGAAIPLALLAGNLNRKRQLSLNIIKCLKIKKQHCPQKF